MADGRCTVEGGNSALGVQERGMRVSGVDVGRRRDGVEFGWVQAVGVPPGMPPLFGREVTDNRPGIVQSLRRATLVAELRQRGGDAFGRESGGDGRAGRGDGPSVPRVHQRLPGLILGKFNRRLQEPAPRLTSRVLAEHRVVVGGDERT